MRDLNATYNLLEVIDPISGDVHKIRYRTPTNAERIAYAGAMMVRDGKKIKLRVNAFDLNVEYGASVMTGFETGTFCFDGRMVSSDPPEDGYRDDWKDLLVENCPEIVAAVGQTVFAGARVRKAGENNGSEIMIELEDFDDVPLPSASTATCSAATDDKDSAAPERTVNG